MSSTSSRTVNREIGVSGRWARRLRESLGTRVVFLAGKERPRLWVMRRKLRHTVGSGAEAVASPVQPGLHPLESVPGALVASSMAAC